MVRFERAGVGADFQGKQHGRIHFEISFRIEIRAQFFHDFRTQTERLLHVVVHDKIEVAQAVFHILILQAVVFFGQGEQGFR